MRNFKTSAGTASRSPRPWAGIVVGMHNYEAILSQCLDSVRQQIHHDWECILVDNGSTDSTVAVAEQLIEGDSRFQILRCPNRGPSAGRNAGVCLLSSAVEYVVFLDGDDKLDPGFLSALTGYLDKHPFVGAVGCHYIEMNASGTPLCKRIRSRWRSGPLGFPQRIPLRTPDTPFETFFSVTGNGPFFLFRRSALPTPVPYDESLWFCEDSDILCSIALTSSVHFVPDFLYLKRTHSANLSHKRVGAGEHAFRLKWDSPERHAAQYRSRIESATRYYYRRHVPLRDIKVAVKSVIRCLRTGETAPLRFAASLVLNAARGAAGRTEPRRQHSR